MGAYQPDLYQQPSKTNAKSTETFYVTVVYGSSAPASAKGRYMAVADTAQGKITVKFPRTYRRLLAFHHGWIKCAAGAVYMPVILTNTIDTAGTHGGGEIVLETRTEAGTATDPASGDELSLTFVCSLDVVNDDDAITIS